MQVKLKVYNSAHNNIEVIVHVLYMHAWYMHGICMQALLQLQSLKVSETDRSNVFVELLRGRDGLPGRDGAWTTWKRWITRTSWT